MSPWLFTFFVDGGKMNQDVDAKLFWKGLNKERGKGRELHQNKGWKLDPEVQRVWIIYF